ncbi:hypothetical protein CLCR_04410 [Cladophialophora carrionii]|uniref:Uncharacterized protein n=1 Tax=Cladophialophora carrionii TaxID=86049 RepID=A0A1C1CHX5_9EURO|nr:hypothetical protein CLCR_04410 [Cladophialophora carrionii]
MSSPDIPRRASLDVPPERTPYNKVRLNSTRIHQTYSHGRHLSTANPFVSGPFPPLSRPRKAEGFTRGRYNIAPLINVTEPACIPPYYLAATSARSKQSRPPPPQQERTEVAGALGLGLHHLEFECQSSREVPSRPRPFSTTGDPNDFSPL